MNGFPLEAMITKSELVHRRHFKGRQITSHLAVAAFSLQFVAKKKQDFLNFDIVQLQVFPGVSIEHNSKVTCRMEIHIFFYKCACHEWLYIFFQLLINVIEEKNTMSLSKPTILFLLKVNWSCGLHTLHLVNVIHLHLQLHFCEIPPHGYFLKKETKKKNTLCASKPFSHI